MMRPTSNELGSFSYRRLLTALVAATLLPLAVAVYAQQQSQDPNWRPKIWVGGYGGWRRTAPKWGTRENFDGAWTYCPGFYYTDRREDGGSGWGTALSGAATHFSCGPPRSPTPPTKPASP